MNKKKAAGGKQRKLNRLGGRNALNLLGQYIHNPISNFWQPQAQFLRIDRTKDRLNEKMDTNMYTNIRSVLRSLINRYPI